jgi:uncharacterized membrane protein
MDAGEVAKIIFGSILVLFVPGFAWSYIFFDRGRIDGIERAALSFGLSVALVPLTVFWFNWVFNVGITLVNTWLIVCGITIVAIIWLYARKRMWTARMADRFSSRMKLSRHKDGE